MGRLDGQVVIVTGGTGGIGRAVCRGVVAEGGRVTVADVGRERIDEVVAELGSERALGFPFEAREDENHALVQTTLSTFGRIDGLVAAAGILRKRGTPPKPVVQITVDEWDDVIDINLKGTFLSNRAVLPTLIAQHSGTIVNVSSVSGLVGRAHDGAYCASKFGVVGLSQVLAEEVRRDGVRVQVVCPHAIDTPMWEQNHPVPKPGDALPPERVGELIVTLLALPADTTLLNVQIAPLGARKRKPKPETAAS
ncbi:MAG: SDR family oxidoreductase [Deltaproteobacteria bacterium]|nr:SDR family oxidoreductase [Deltaproteobacteria bacterium]